MPPSKVRILDISETYQIQPIADISSPLVNLYFSMGNFISIFIYIK